MVYFFKKSKFGLRYINSGIFSFYEFFNPQATVPLGPGKNRELGEKVWTIKRQGCYARLFLAHFIPSPLFT